MMLIFGMPTTFALIKVYIVYTNTKIINQKNIGYISSWMIPECSDKTTTDISDLYQGLRIYFNVLPFFPFILILFQVHERTFLSAIYQS